MKLQEYIDEIKLELTGDILELEVTDETLGKYVSRALREIQRYIDITRLVTVPFRSCIDLTNEAFVDGVSSVTAVYRTRAFASSSNTDSNSLPTDIDPMQAQMWQIFSSNSGSTMGMLNSYVMNYLSYNTLLQMRNTTSTDLFFKEDKLGKKLYVNADTNTPDKLTIEYVPQFIDVEKITSDYWIDILQRLSIAFVKIALGRIRTRYTQNNAVWTQDGETLLEEGNKELTELREVLRTNSVLFYPVD